MSEPGVAAVVPTDCNCAFRAGAPPGKEPIFHEPTCPVWGRWPSFPRPLRNRVLVKELAAETTTPSGLLHLPQTASQHEQNWRALVLAVGPGKPAPELLKRAASWLRRQLGNERTPLPLGHFDDGRAIRDELDAGLERGFGEDVKPGDIVIVSKYIHTEVRVGGEVCRIIASTDILAVLEDYGDEKVAQQCNDLVRRVLDREVYFMGAKAAERAAGERRNTSHAARPGEMTINGKNQEIPWTPITYEDVLELGGFAPGRVLTVTYRGRGAKHGDARREGTLVPGSSVAPESGMVFNVSDTSAG